MTISKKRIEMLFMILLSSIITIRVNAQKNILNSATIIDNRFHDGAAKLRVQFITGKIIRIQVVTNESEFRNSGLNRYSFIHPINDKVRPDISRDKTGFSAKTPFMRIQVNNLKGEIIIFNKEGKKVIDQVGTDFTDGFSKAVFTANDNEDWIGFGDQTRDRIYHRGYIANCNIMDVKSYVPVPFFMSTEGVGTLVNTTFHTRFDMCKTSPNKYSWKNKSGIIDYYVMVGAGFKELINLYTDLTGKPKLPPEWSFGLWFICNIESGQFDVLNVAKGFRSSQIPCDVIGLEPGWMKKSYDASTYADWNPNRFYHPKWMGNAAPPFIRPIKEMGYKMELWLCNNYDLTYEAERHVSKPFQDDSIRRLKKITDTHSDNFDQYANEKAYRLIGDKDTITKVGEPWFAHLEKFVDQGINFFKQDAAYQVFFHPDRLWGNGMKDDEMHNLYNLMYSRQMYEGFKAKTNLRPVVFTSSGWTGFQAFAGTWTGDTGGGLPTLGGLVNTAIVGGSWATIDMDNFSREGIHFGYLLPWSQINSWASFKMPWLLGDSLSEINRYYAQLRYRLIPYLYSFAREATKTGWPLLRPLTLVFPNDKECRENLHQYLLGPYLMVGIYNKDIYFPKGKWKNYWTGQVTGGPQKKDVSWPSNRGGALYVRSGAIIPMGPVMQYWGEKPLDSMSVYIFPDKEKSMLKFYEDDGVSFDYLKGDLSTTRITAEKLDSGSIITISKPEGSFTGMVKNRRWTIVMNQATKPNTVQVNGKKISQNLFSWNSKRKELTIKQIKAPAKVEIW